MRKEEGMTGRKKRNKGNRIGKELANETGQGLDPSTFALKKGKSQGSWDF